jgi:lysozyme
MHSAYLDAIRTFEGYAGQARWDYGQFTNGYGTRAAHPGEVVDRAEADRRFTAAVAGARAVVERQAPGLDEGTKAALTSLTYNAGPGWVDDGLGDAVRRGDLAEIRTIFAQYNKAGGEVVAGLVSRRATEAMWIGNPEGVSAGANGTAQARSVGSSAPQQLASLARTLAAHDLAANAGGGVGAPRAAGAETTFARGLLAAADTPGAGPAAVTPLTLASVSEIARLVQLQAGHDLVARGEDRAPADRGRSEKA